MTQILSSTAVLAVRDEHGYVVGIGKRLLAGLSSLKRRGFGSPVIDDPDSDGWFPFDFSSFGGFFSDRAWRLTGKIRRNFMSRLEVGEVTFSVTSPSTNETSFFNGPEVDEVALKRIVEVMAVTAMRRRLLPDLERWPWSYRELHEQTCDVPDGGRYCYCEEREERWHDLHGGPIVDLQVNKGFVLQLHDDPHGDGRVIIKGGWEAPRQVLEILAMTLMTAPVPPKEDTDEASDWERELLATME